MERIKEELIQIESQNSLQLYNRFPILLKRGMKASVFDEKGERYIDALAGIAVNNVGHCHPEVVKAIKNQADKLIHTSNFYYTEPQIKLSAKLCELSGLDKTFYCNSGAEANEAAIKFARNYANKNGYSGPVLSFHGGFHGRTLTTLALGKSIYQNGFEPIPEGFIKCAYNDEEQLRKVFKNQKPIAVILEIIQGEGGINIAHHDWLHYLQDLCFEFDTLLIVDEIQTGFARTGSFFAYQKTNLSPDIVTCAKALGGGVPIGAVMLKQKVAELLEPGQHGTTFGGNLIACAAAIATISVIENEKLCQMAHEKGTRFLRQLKDKLTHCTLVKEIRGIGLMIGIELHIPAKQVVYELMQQHILANATANNVIRLVPPLVIDDTDLDQIVKALTQILMQKELSYAKN